MRSLEYGIFNLNILVTLSFRKRNNCHRVNYLAYFLPVSATLKSASFSDSADEVMLFLRSVSHRERARTISEIFCSIRLSASLIDDSGLANAAAPVEIMMGTID